jgi:hypothetical protein
LRLFNKVRSEQTESELDEQHASRAAGEGAGGAAAAAAGGSKAAGAGAAAQVAADGKVASCRSVMARSLYDFAAQGEAAAGAYTRSRQSSI